MKIELACLPIDKERLRNLVRRTIQRGFLKSVGFGLIKEVTKSKTNPTRYYELL